MYTPKLPENLTEPENKLIAACAAGEVCYLGDGELPPEDAEEDRTIRAEVIRFLAMSGDDEHRVDPRGIWLRGALILGELELTNTDVPVDLVFFFCRFEMPLILLSAQLRTLNMQGSLIPGILGDRAQFAGGVFLRNSFSSTGGVRFVGAKVNGNFDCSKGNFQNQGKYALNLQKANIYGALFLRDNCRIKGFLNLASCHVDDLLDEMVCWPEKGKLILNGFCYEHITGGAPTDWKSRLNWLERQHPLFLNENFHPQPYEQLAKVLREMGHAGDAREILIAKQDRLYGRPGTPKWMQWWGRLLKATIGYGYKPWKVLIPALLAVFLGIGVYGQAWVDGDMVPAKERVHLSDVWVTECRDKNHLSRKACVYENFPEYPRYGWLTYSLDVFLPIVNLHQEEFWLPSAENWSGMLVRWFMWLQIAAGWMLTSLGVAGLTGIVKKD